MQTWNVRHLITVKNTRFLYTTKVHESINHHLVKGFNYGRYRKTDYIDEEQQKNKNRDFLERFINDQEGAYDDEEQVANARNYDGAKQNLQKEAFLALRLINVQLNCQNENTKSQVLLTSNDAHAVVFTYTEPLVQDQNRHFLKFKAGKLESDSFK